MSCMYNNCTYIYKRVYAYSLSTEHIFFWGQLKINELQKSVVRAFTTTTTNRSRPKKKGWIKQRRDRIATRVITAAQASDKSVITISKILHHIVRMWIVNSTFLFVVVVAVFYFSSGYFVVVLVVHFTLQYIFIYCTTNICICIWNI